VIGGEWALAGAALLVLGGVLASKVSSRLGVPALLLFMGVGMLAGSEGVGGIEFTDYELAQTVGIVALAYILFAGGLGTGWRDIRPVLGHGVGLATVGVAITAAIAGSVAAWALGLSWTTGLLLGAIISSTDAAAVFSVLGSRNASLRGELRPLLEFESGSNDPMAVFLTIGFIQLLTEPDRSVTSLVPLFLQQATVGLVAGVVIATATIWTINRMRLEYDGLYSVVTLTIVMLTYASTAALGGSGFLAVYVAGILMGNSEFVHKKSLHRFHEAIAWLGQISMFLVLGLLVFPSRLLDVAGRSLLVAFALIVLARPVATFAVLCLTRFGVRDQLMVSWVGLRGAVPIVLATFALQAGVPEAQLIFDVVFFCVLTSVLIQGTSIPLVARWLGVDAPVPERRNYPLEAVSSGHEGATLHELVLGPGSPAADRPIVELGLPKGSLVVLVSRGDEFVVPQGSTTLYARDTVLVLADATQLAHVRHIIEGDGSGPPERPSHRWNRWARGDG
jgi:potassium/hydrogen antiporter